MDQFPNLKSSYCFITNLCITDHTAIERYLPNLSPGCIAPIVTLFLVGIVIELLVDTKDEWNKSYSRV